MNECWYFFVLAVLMLYHGRDAFPFVTLLVIALCTIAAFEVLPLERKDVCATADTASWFRIIFHNFFFGDITHWFGCMVGWLMCAPVLEQQRGSTVLFAILCAAIVIDNIMYSFITLEKFPWTRWLSTHGCAVGLSGVIFCFETLLAQSGTAQPCVVLGMVCKRSIKLVCMRLIIIQVLFENVSFYGHASGILAGFVIYCLLPYADRTFQSNRWGPIVERLNSWMKHFTDRLFRLCIILLVLGFTLCTYDILISNVRDTLHASISSLFASSRPSAPSSSAVHTSHSHNPQRDASSLAPRVASRLGVLVAGMALWCWLMRDRRTLAGWRLWDRALTHTLIRLRERGEAE